MLKKEVPHQEFVNAVRSGFEKEAGKREGRVAASYVWDHVVMQCFMTPAGFDRMFSWRISTAKNINAIQDIIDAVGHGFVPGLKVVDHSFIMRES